MKKKKGIKRYIGIGIAATGKRMFLKMKLKNLKIKKKRPTEKEEIKGDKRVFLFEPIICVYMKKIG